MELFGLADNLQRTSQEPHVHVTAQSGRLKRAHDFLLCDALNFAFGIMKLKSLDNLVDMLAQMIYRNHE